MTSNPLHLLRAPLALAWRDGFVCLSAAPGVPAAALPVDAVAALPDAIAALLAAHRHRRLAWRIGDEHARLFHAERPVGARTPLELEVALGQRAQALFGDDGAAWVMRWTGAPWARADTVCALPQALLDALADGARRVGGRCTSVRCDWVAEAARAPRRGHAWVLNAGVHVLTLGLLDAGRCVGVRRLAPVAPDDDLADVMARAQVLFAGPPEIALAPVWVSGEPLPFPLGLAVARARRLDSSAIAVPGERPRPVYRARMPGAGR